MWDRSYVSSTLLLFEVQPYKQPNCTQVFGPYVTITRGIDVSPNMVAAYNARARTANLPASKVNAMVGNLFDKQAPSNELVGPEWENFDLVTAGFAFHHFEDVVHAAKCLKERLRPGGALVITDYLEGADMKADENGDPIPGSEGSHATMHRHSHGHKHGQGHIQDHAENGFLNSDVKTMADSIMTPSFTMEAVRELFTKAGLVDVDVVKMPERVYLEFGGQRIWRVILLAKGRRPLEESEG